MQSYTQQRVENLLTTIDRLGVVKIKHLLAIHDLKSYRNACRIITTQLRPFIHETYYQNEKVMYLNKKGKEFIGSEKEDIKISQRTLHDLLRNEVYIYLRCPIDWKNEYVLEVKQKQNKLGINFGNLNVVAKKKVIADAAFSRNGYFHLVEVDNERKMIDNRKKIESYREVLPAYKDKLPILMFFTKTEHRKQKLEEWLKGLRSEVKTFDEIR